MTRRSALGPRAGAVKTSVCSCGQSLPVTVLFMNRRRSSRMFLAADLGELSQQMRAYGSGCTAALTALVLHNRRARIELSRRVVVGIIRLSSIGKRTNDDPVLPSGLIAREYLGMLLGPWLYLKARHNLRRSANQESPAHQAEHDRCPHTTSNQSRDQ